MPQPPEIVSGPSAQTHFGAQGVETWPMWEVSGPPGGTVFMDYPGMDDPIEIPVGQDGYGSYAVPPTMESGLFEGETYDFTYWSEDADGAVSDSVSFSQPGIPTTHEQREINAARNRGWKDGGLSAAAAAEAAARETSSKPVGDTSRPVTGGGGSGSAPQVSAGGGQEGTAAGGAGASDSAAAQRQTAGVEKGNTP